jgi:hypothetical protein
LNGHGVTVLVGRKSYTWYGILNSLQWLKSSAQIHTLRLVGDGMTVTVGTIRVGVGGTAVAVRVGVLRAAAVSVRQATSVAQLAAGVEQDCGCPEAIAAPTKAHKAASISSPTMAVAMRRYR